MNCFHCNSQFSSSDEKITISKDYNTEYLNFHIRCFIEIAGEQYVPYKSKISPPLSEWSMTTNPPVSKPLPPQYICSQKDLQNYAYKIREKLEMGSIKKVSDIPRLIEPDFKSKLPVGIQGSVYLDANQRAIVFEYRGKEIYKYYISYEMFKSFY